MFNSVNLFAVVMLIGAAAVILGSIIWGGSQELASSFETDMNFKFADAADPRK